MLSKQLAVLIFIAFFAIGISGSNAAPTMTGIDHVNQVKAILEVLSKSAEQASKAVAVPLHNFLAKNVQNVHPSQNRNLKQDAPPGGPPGAPPGGQPGGDPCISSQSQQCSNPSSQEQACMMQAQSLFGRMFVDGGFNPFSLPAVMCQAQTRNASFASCVPILFNQLKTCACMDFQPMYNLVCPTSPTASLCSRNAAVQEFLALNTNTSLGIFAPMSNFGRLLSPEQETDFHPCGDRSMYRSTILINSIGSCLTDIVNAFPFPTWFNATGPQGSISSGHPARVYQLTYDDSTMHFEI